jgi:TolB-like protein/DNA-binding winged helix-turn-helix (wHTH) protein/Tfp pilus assembly protein PilF
VPRPQIPSGRLRFGPYEVDLRSGEVRKRGIKIAIQDQPFRVLQVLIERSGDVVSREELRRQLWPEDTFVAFDMGLNNAIKRLREALSDSAETPRYVETLPRRGYRFIAPTTNLEESGDIEAQRTVTAAKLGSRRSRAWTVRVAAALAVLTVGVTLYTVRREMWPSPRAATGKSMLAVLPFENLSGDPEQEYFSDGMTEEMIAQVSRISPEHLGVIARTSAMQYKGTKKNVAQIGRELGVSYILESSVRREGNRVRVTAQLVRVSDQTHVWAQSYERDVRELLPLESEVTQEIAREIEIKLSLEERTPSGGARPVDPEAHELYLKGRYFWNKRTQDGFWKGIGYFKLATEKDPNYAQAYAGIADSYILLGPNDVLPARQVYPLAKSAALKAVQIDDELGEAHASLGFIKLLYDWNPVAAEKEFRRAIELDRNYPTAHHWYAYDLVVTRRMEEALREIRHAQQLDPLSLTINADIGQVLFLARRYDDAIAQCQQTVDLDPGYAHVFWYLGLAYEQKGMFDQAVQALVKEPSPAPIDPKRIEEIEAVRHTAGTRGYWRERLAVLQAESRKHYVSPYTIAVAYARMDDRANALDNLEKAYAERYPSMVFVRIEPVFDTLRGDPRFENLLRRIDSSAQE